MPRRRINRDNKNKSQNGLAQLRSLSSHDAKALRMTPSPGSHVSAKELKSRIRKLHVHPNGKNKRVKTRTIEEEIARAPKFQLNVDSAAVTGDSKVEDMEMEMDVAPPVDSKGRSGNATPSDDAKMEIIGRDRGDA